MVHWSQYLGVTPQNDFQLKCHIAGLNVLITRKMSTVELLDTLGRQDWEKVRCLQNCYNAIRKMCRWRETGRSKIFKSTEVNEQTWTLRKGANGALRNTSFMMKGGNSTITALYILYFYLSERCKTLNMPRSARSLTSFYSCQVLLHWNKLTLIHSLCTCLSSMSYIHVML